MLENPQISGKIDFHNFLSNHGGTDAAKLHAFHVYHQVQVWGGNNSLTAEDWGWYIKGNFMLPKSSEKPPAPENLLKLIKM